MLATSGGNLILLPGNTDPGSPAASQIASTPSTVPGYTPGDTDTWNTFLIAHRGTLEENGVDDLFAYNTRTHQMYKYGNDKELQGTPGYFTKTQDVTSLSRPTCTETCNGYYTNASNSNDWGTITQMIAPGSIGTTAGDDRPTLITMENGQLWLYTFTGNVLNSPVLLGTGNWSNFDLIAPGTLGGNLNTTPQTAGTPTLWVRDRTTGTLYTMPITNSQGTVQTLTPPTLPLTLPLTAADGNHLCADDDFGLTTTGNPVQTWDCDQTNAQSWTMHTNGTITAVGNCLDLATTTPVNGTTAVLNPCATTPTATSGGPRPPPASSRPPAACA
ncbi:ricin-type beta-trefoil lectin domain protein [Streptacidiphilus albus]|nr:ricin-type beta-trefoil lectin domain protein [Streptacidiphilus albus]